LAGKGVEALGEGYGQEAAARTIGNQHGNPSGYIPTTEVHPSKLPKGDPRNFVKFRTAQVRYIPHSDVLKFKSLVGKALNYARQEVHSLVKGNIPQSAIDEAVIDGAHVIKGGAPVPRGC
jgi:hypothetical protein